MSAQVYLLAGTASGLFVFQSDQTRRRWQRSGPYLAPAEVCCVLCCVLTDSTNNINNTTDIADTANIENTVNTANLTVDKRGKVRFWAGILAADQGPALYVSEDLGRTWRHIVGAAELTAGTRQPLRRLWHLAAGPPGQLELLYAGVEGAALLASRDGGRSWHEVEGLARAMRQVAPVSALRDGWVHSVVIDPARPERMWAGVQVAGVYRTDDGGTTWMPCNAGLPEPAAWDLGPAAGYCVHKLALDSTRPGQLYLQHREGVFASHDGGWTWYRIDQGLPGRFGFPICVTRTGAVLVVPLESAERRVPPHGRLQIYSSQDGGVHWQPLGMCGKIPHHGGVLRDALAVDPLDPPGIYLGTTTGELYASTDGGQTWDLLSEHLPRITAVTAGVRDGTFGPAGRAQ